MVRYFTFLLISFLLAVYILWFCISLQGLFARAVFLTNFLYNGEVDPTPLDGRITYSCLPERKYAYNTDIEAVRALEFYRSKWGSQTFDQTVEYTSEYICLGHQVYHFADDYSLWIVMFYNLLPFTYMLYCFLIRAISTPFRRLFCREINLFEHILSA